MALLAIYHIVAALKTAVGGTAAWQRYGGEKINSWLNAQRQPVLRDIAVMEIATGVALGLGAFRFGIRAVMSTFMYFSLLRTRFWTQNTRAYHLMAWQTIGEFTAPVVARVGLLQTIVERGKGWFNAAAPQVRQHAE